LLLDSVMEMGLPLNTVIADLGAVPSPRQTVAQSAVAPGGGRLEHTRTVDEGPWELEPDKMSCSTPETASNSSRPDFRSTVSRRMHSDEPVDEHRDSTDSAVREPPVESQALLAGPGSDKTASAEGNASKLRPIHQGASSSPLAQADQGPLAVTGGEKSAQVLLNARVIPKRSATSSPGENLAKVPVGGIESAAEPSKADHIQGASGTKLSQPVTVRLLGGNASAAPGDSVGQAGAKTASSSSNRIASVPDSKAEQADGGPSVKPGTVVALTRQAANTASQTAPAAQHTPENASGSGQKTLLNDSLGQSTDRSEAPRGFADNLEAMDDPDRLTSVLASTQQGGREQGVLGEREVLRDSLLRQLNASYVEVGGSRQKTQGQRGSDGGSAGESPSPLGSTDPPNLPAGPRLAVVQTARQAPDAAGTGVGRAVGEQIQDSIKGSMFRMGQRFTIRLNPPELGKVFARFHSQDNQIIGLLEVSKPETAAEIRQALPEIVRDLQDLGVQIKRLDVLLTSEHERDATGGEWAPQREGWLQHGGSSYSETHTGTTESAELSGAAWYKDVTRCGNGALGDGSIDMFA